MVRVYYSAPLSEIEASSDHEEEKLGIVLNYYRVIHFLSAVESLAFANRVSLPLAQLLTLANDAAGGSAMFRKYGQAIANVLQKSNDSTGQENEQLWSIDQMIEVLEKVLDAAKAVKCPLFLAAAAYDILLALRRQGKGSSGGANVVSWWKSEA
jgi:3-hydroxyisobutyrate dehydrogenase